MPRPLLFCLCADDYAMTRGISRGILEALEHGALSATSVMTTSRHWPEQAEPLARFAGHADIGLHLNLTLGRPLAPMPTFARDDKLPAIRSVIGASRKGDLPLTEIAGEIERQAEVFVSVMKRPPDHVDGHQHVHVLPPIRDLLFAELKRRGWRPQLRNSADRWFAVLQRGACLRKALGVTVLARGLSQAAARAGISVNDGFAGFSSFDPRMSYATSFARYLKAPGARHLVMCHPGHVDDELRRLDPVVETREQELDFFLSSAFKALLAERGASLTPLSRL